MKHAGENGVHFSLHFSLHGAEMEAYGDQTAAASLGRSQAAISNLTDLPSDRIKK